MFDSVMLFIFALPVMQVILFCLAIGRDPTGIHIGVVNHEMDWDLQECPIYPGCNLTKLSCRYIHQLSEKKTLEIVSKCKYNS